MVLPQLHSYFSCWIPRHWSADLLLWHLRWHLNYIRHSQHKQTRNGYFCPKSMFPKIHKIISPLFLNFIVSNNNLNSTREVSCMKWQLRWQFVARHFRLCPLNHHQTSPSSRTMPKLPLVSPWNWPSWIPAAPRRAPGMKLTTRQLRWVLNNFESLGCRNVHEIFVRPWSDSTR